MRLIGRLLLDADHIVGPWTSKRIPVWNGWLPPQFNSAGIVSDGKIIGGVVFFQNRGFDCWMAIAFEDPRAALPETFKNLARYAFHDLKLSRVTAFVSKKNKRVRRFLKGVGFVEEGTHRLAYDGRQDAITYGMLASECRWLRGA